MVVADDRSNAIVVVAENDEVQKIADFIQQLDVAESAHGDVLGGPIPDAWQLT